MSSHDDLQSAFAEVLGVANGLELLGDPGDPLDLVDDYRHRASLLSFALDSFVLSRPEAPVFVRSFNNDDRSERKYLGDNADTRYFYTNISADYEYIIRGRRGDEVYLSFVVHGGHPTDQLRQLIQSNINHRELEVAADGTFEIHLSRNRKPGNWLELKDGAACVLAREYYLDREAARWASFAIERVDGPPAAPTPAATAEGLRATAAFLQTILAATKGGANRPVHEFSPPFRLGTSLPGWGTPDNVYAGCRFDLAPDEMLLVEGQMVACDYWNVQLWNVQMQSIGTGPGKASVNYAEAGLKPGDPFVVAVSAADPGVRPWLATGGRRRGRVYVRWLCADEIPPVPTARVVKI